MLMNTHAVQWKPFSVMVIKVALFSVIANVVLTYAGKVMSAPPSSFGPYMYSSVVWLTILGVICAALGYVAALWYFTEIRRAHRWYAICATIALLVSFYPDVAMPWSTDADQVGWTYGIIANLILMHIATYAIVLWYFLKYGDAATQYQKWVVLCR